MTARQPPSLRRRRLAGELRTLRVAAGLDIGDAAERAGFSRSKLSRIESLDLNISGDDTDVLCQALDVDDDKRDALVSLARQARRRGWWQVYPDDALGVSRDLLELEDDATELRSYTDVLVPGHMQTHGYACAVIHATSPQLTSDTVDQQARVRLERQERMEQRGVEMWAILDEYALTRGIGGPSTMAEQIERLIEIAGQPGNSVQILPQGLPGHVALGMPYKIMTLRGGAKYAYADALGGGLYLETPEQIEKQEHRWRLLAAQALSFDDTVTCLRQAATNQRSGTHDEPRTLRVAQE